MVAQTALELATKHPELVFRNPEKVRQGWEQMRENRTAFVDFFGSDELVLPVAEAEEQVNAFYRKQQEAVLARNARRIPGRDVPGVDSPLLQLPQELAEGGSIGVPTSTRWTGSASVRDTGCSGTCSATRLSRLTSDTRTCCVTTCGTTRSRLRRCCASPPPSRTR